MMMKTGAKLKNLNEEKKRKKKEKKEKLKKKIFFK